MKALTPEQWKEIFYALQHQLGYPCIGQIPREQRPPQSVIRSARFPYETERNECVHLTAIIEAIGPDGFNAALGGVVNCGSKEIHVQKNMLSMIVLTPEDWMAIYHAVENKRRYVQDRPFGGEPEYDADWIACLTAIIEAIGPDGLDAARQGVCPGDPAAIHREFGSIDDT